MSIFFTKITEIFDNQKKEIDFKKENGHYIDKTFNLNINNQNPKTNCFLFSCPIMMKKILSSFFHCMNQTG